MDNRTDISGFLRADNGRVVDAANHAALRCGVGLGNWLLPEGYMWCFPDHGPQSPREIEAFVSDLIGADSAAEFWQEYRRKYLTAEDVQMIAGAGFDHVRLPLNARELLNDDGRVRADAFDPIDQLINWCRAAGLHVVIDLHAAPGGQTGTNIDDSANGRPELFENAEYRRQTLQLWQSIASRYAKEPVVAGYDLLNEPLPGQWQDQYAQDLVSLYRELTKSIRAVDTNHLIIYEGTDWANDWRIFTEVWDPQSVLEFHKYWSKPDRESISQYLQKGAELDLPIYMGEGGENNIDWIATVFGVYTDLGIPWSFWTWKKVNTTTAVLSIHPPNGWDQILAYAGKTGPKPTEEAAKAALWEFLDNLKASRCEVRADLLNALFRRLPLELPGVAYGFAAGDYQFSETAAANGIRQDEPAPIRYDQSESVPDALDWGYFSDALQRLWLDLAPGDQVRYRVHVPYTTELNVSVRGAGDPPEVSIESLSAESASAVLSKATGWELRCSVPGGPVGITVSGTGAGTQINRLVIA